MPLPRKIDLDPDNPHAKGLFSDSARAGIGIEMSNGERFTILAPKPEMVDPEVIAHSLSKLCRFTGHCQRYYSVAQHCVHVSRLVPPAHALEGLLHDASEAYIGDVSRPLKAILDVLAPGILTQIEDRIHRVIAKRFGTRFPHPSSVKYADNVALATEKRDLMVATSATWFDLPVPDERIIRPLGPKAAETAWLSRFQELTE